MKHTDIRRKLPEYLDDVVTPAEREAIEAHLRTCDACRSALEELKITTGYIRNLEQVDPPKWLAARVMARVREESERNCGFFRRLAMTLNIRLSIEAAALVLVAITGYLVFRAAQPETSLTGTVSREEPGKTAIAPSAASAPEKLERSETVKNDKAAQRDSHANLPAREAGHAMKGMAQPNSDAARKAATSAAPSRVLPAPGLPEAVREKEESRVLPGPATQAMKPQVQSNEEKSGNADMLYGRKKGSLPEISEARISLVPRLRNGVSTAKEIERLIADLGGRIIRKETGGKNEIISVSLKNSKFDELLDKLRGLGEVRADVKEVALPAGAERTLSIELKQPQ